MSNQVVMLGSKIIPLVTPRSDVDIFSRQVGGKFYIPELVGRFDTAPSTRHGASIQV